MSEFINKQLEETHLYHQEAHAMYMQTTTNPVKQDETQLLIDQLEQCNQKERDFEANNQHRLRYTPVQWAYTTIRRTQPRFELLFKIIEKQQEEIKRLRRDYSNLNS